MRYDYMHIYIFILLFLTLEIFYCFTRDVLPKVKDFELQVRRVTDLTGVTVIIIYVVVS